MASVTSNHISVDERGVAWIDDTNIKVIEVALEHVAHGASSDEIFTQHAGHLSLAQIHAALTHYFDHQAEYDAEIERQVRDHDVGHASSQDSPGRRRLRALRQTLVSVKLYMDVHVRRAVTLGLRRRGVDVITAQEDENAHLPDDRLLMRASELGRAVFSQDDDLLREARRRQSRDEHFAGVIYAHQLRITTGQTIRDLELIAKVYEPADLENQVEYLPL